MDKEIYSQILNKIKLAERILITTHENPDGDAIGSACAMAELIARINKSYYIFCQDEPEASLYFLSQVEKIKVNLIDIPFTDLDLVIAVDCSRLQRSRIEDEIKKEQLPIKIGRASCRERV